VEWKHCNNREHLNTHSDHTPNIDLLGVLLLQAVLRFANLIALRRNVTFPLDMELLHCLNFESGLGTVTDKFNPAANMPINPEASRTAARTRARKAGLLRSRSPLATI
jgi:hypothetical protein